jgi:excisionase family DNA binding protein
MAVTSNDELLTPAEVAALFRVEPKTVTRWAEAGKLSTIRTLGGHRRFRAREIRKLLWTPDSEFANQPVHVSGVIRPERPEKRAEQVDVASWLQPSKNADAYDGRSTSRGG